MGETKKGSVECAKTKDQGLKAQFTLTLVSVLIMVAALLLPYLSAVGDMAEYIEKHPDRIEVESMELAASDLANVSFISVSNIITGVYGEDDGTVAKVIVMVFCGCLVLTALFVVIKKPVGVIIFDLLSFGVFFFLNFLIKDDFIGADKYTWGIGYYAIMVGSIALLVSAIWMLATKISIKRQAKMARISNTIEE